MPSFVDQTPSPHLADFIHTVGELETAVLDCDLGVTSRQITTVDVGDARHVGLVDPECLEFAVQGRSLHADEFCSPRYVAAETADLCDQIFTLKYFTCLAQRQSHQVLASVSVRHTRHHRADVRRQHACIHHCFRITAR